MTVERTVEFRYSDLVAGEKRMELQVVPPFDVTCRPDIAVVPSLSTPPENRTRGAGASAAPELRHVARIECHRQQQPERRR